MKTKEYLLDLPKTNDILCLTTSKVTFIYKAVLTIQIVTKQLHNIKVGKLCQKCKMTRFNTQFSAEGISLLNLVMSSSSSVQFK